MPEPAKGEYAMANTDKNLCKWSKKNIEKNMASLREIVARPRFVCAKCARVAADKKPLCKPVPLEQNDTSDV